MFNAKRKTVALLAVSLVFAAADTVSASADSASYGPSTTQAWHGRSPARLYLDARGDAYRAKAGVISAPTSGAAVDDLCEPVGSYSCNNYHAG